MNEKPGEAAIEKELRSKLEKALALKDYAVSKNFDVPDDVIAALNGAARAANPLDAADEVDRAIRDLTALTYPATIETVALAGDSYRQNPAFKAFFYILLAIGIFALSVAVLTFVGMQLQPPSAPGQATTAPSSFFRVAAPSVLAACLGVLGCLTYIIFNIIGVLREKAFDKEDTVSNYARLVLGAIIGWIFYLGFGKEDVTKSDSSSVLVLLPFLAGFSTRLVVGIINQAIRAVELTLALEDKGAELAQRRAKKSEVFRKKL
jgi:hypothetical protein